MKKLFVLLAILITSTNLVFAESNTEAVLEYNQGIDYYKIGQYDKAVTRFKSAIQLDPDYIDAYYNLGSVLEYIGQYDAALSVFKQVIVRQPNDYDSVYKAAWLSYQLGEYSKAKVYLSIIPPTSARADDAASLLAQMKSANIPTAKATVQPPKKPALSQTNNLYSNLESPTGVTTDNMGNLFVAGFNNNTITKITPTEQRIVFAKSPLLDGPIGLAADKLGNIYVANYNKNNVLKISNMGEISVLISNLKKPYCVTVSGNILFISCQGSNSVLKYKL